MTVARARADMRDVATARDADDVIELMKFSLRDFYGDDDPLLVAPVAMGGGGGGKGVKAEGKRLVEGLRAMRAQGRAEVSKGDISALADRLRLEQPLDVLVDALNEAGMLLRRAGGMYKLG